MDEREQTKIFDEWLSRHRGVLFKVVHCYAFTPEDRCALFQEIVTQMWNSTPRFRGDAAVPNWLLPPCSKLRPGLVAQGTGISGPD
jgi:RNA polymerase sigma-70 factor (ECF subfamily)